MWQKIGQAISTATGTVGDIRAPQLIGGGCINESFRLQIDRQDYFVKLNRADLLPMFDAEVAGLDAIRSSGSLRAPHPVARGVSADRAWLALEFIEFSGAQQHSQALLGAGLAAMHRRGADHFGWPQDNWIGTSPQPNTPATNWVDFFRRQRLGVQAELAHENGAPSGLQDNLAQLGENLGLLFETYAPEPALLHGDLWAGNWSADSVGNPVIYDPAVYFGDRETDLAMTELFGGFDSNFYAAYREAWPLDPDYPLRRDLYQLYHVLNHFNLFGGNYARQAQQLCTRLLAEIAS